jgi:hypothetical protein
MRFNLFFLAFPCIYNIDLAVVREGRWAEYEGDEDIKNLPTPSHAEPAHPNDNFLQTLETSCCGTRLDRVTENHETGDEATR